MLRQAEVLGNHCPKKNTSWTSCTKLTTSLVNISLKFQTLMSNIRKYFLLKKKKREKLLQSLFSSIKSISVFGNKVVKDLTS